MLLESGRGVWLRTVDGKEYIDGLAGLWNVLVGHGNSELADAARKQMAQLAYSSNYIGAANWYSGGIAHLALFDDKRTTSEILASYNTPCEDLSDAGNIIAQWHFDDAGSATAIDNSQGDAGRDLKPYDGGDTTYTLCGRELPDTADPGDEIEYTVWTEPETDLDIHPRTGVIEWEVNYLSLEDGENEIEVNVKASDGEAFANYVFFIEVIPTESPESFILGPQDGEKTPSSNTVLSWEGLDPEDEPITYRISPIFKS